MILHFQRLPQVMAAAFYIMTSRHRSRQNWCTQWVVRPAERTYRQRKHPNNRQFSLAACVVFCHATNIPVDQPTIAQFYFIRFTCGIWINLTSAAYCSRSTDIFLSAVAQKYAMHSKSCSHPTDVKLDAKKYENVEITTRIQQTAACKRIYRLRRSESVYCDVRNRHDCIVR